MDVPNDHPINSELQDGNEGIQAWVRYWRAAALAAAGVASFLSVLTNVPVQARDAQNLQQDPSPQHLELFIEGSPDSPPILADEPLPYSTPLTYTVSRGDTSLQLIANVIGNSQDERPPISSTNPSTLYLPIIFRDYPETLPTGIDITILNTMCGSNVYSPTLGQFTNCQWGIIFTPSPLEAKDHAYVLRLHGTMINGNDREMIVCVTRGYEFQGLCDTVIPLEKPSAFESQRVIPVHHILQLYFPVPARQEVLTVTYHLPGQVFTKTATWPETP